MTARARLRAVKLVHSFAWLIFASSIVTIGPLALTGNSAMAQRLSALVSIECLVLLANGMRCPLTAIAAKYTDDRRDNFDIYLPLWLARHNKTVFGAWFAVDLILVGALWR